MSEKLDYLLAALDLYLASEIESKEAWERALADYAHVYHSDDDRLPVARAADRALKFLKEILR